MKLRGWSRPNAASFVLWKNFKRQAIIRVAYCSPEGYGGFVGDQYINCQALVLGPYIRTENFDRTTAKALPSTITDHKELPQINLLRLLSVKRVGDNLIAVRK